MKRVIQIFANPHAGKFSLVRLQQLVTRFQNQGAEVIVTESVPYAMAGSHVTEIAVVGGDGTVRDAVTCLMQTGMNLPVAISPTGTVNLLYRELLEQSEYDNTLYYPGLSAGQAMLTCASAGPDSRIIASTSMRLKRWIGRGAYIVAALRQLLFWHDDSFQLDIPDRSINCVGFYLAKGRYYAGPWSFAAEAKGREPTFHGVALTKGGRLAYLRFISDMFLGRTGNQKGLVHFECRTIRISASSHSTIQIDGDCTGAFPITLSIAEPLRLSVA